MKARMGNNYKLVCIIALLLSPQAHGRPNLGAIRQSWTPIHKNYKRVSYLPAAILWQTGIIKNIYLFGRATGSPFYQLAQALFHVVPGQFTITQNKNYPATYITPNLVGKLILTIEDAIATDKKSLDPNELKKLIAQDEDFRNNLGEKVSNPDLPLHLSDTERNEGVESALTLQMSESQKEEIDLKDKIVDNLEILVDGIVSAYEASGYLDTTPTTFKYGLHTILLAFLYEKSSTKEDFQNYFLSELTRTVDDKEKRITFDEKYFTENGRATITDKRWVETSYTMEDVKTTEVYYKSAMPPSDAKTAHDLLGDIDFDQYAYAQIMKTSFLVPFLEPTGYKMVDYRIADKVVSFPDCMETTVRGVCDMIVLDRITYTLKAAENNRELFDFYKKFPAPTARGVADAHKEWTNVVENRELISYNLIYDKRGKTKGSVPSEYEGFVKVRNLKQKLASGKIYTKEKIVEGHTFRQLLVGNRKYLLFDDDDLVAYELMPSLRNLLTLLNDLFNLNIFGTTLQETLRKEDFNSTHLSKVFEKLRISKITDSDNIDTDDLTGNHIVLTIQQQKSTFKIDLSSGHGFISVYNEQQERTPVGKEISKYLQDKSANLDFDDTLLFVLNKPSSQEIMKGPLSLFQQKLLFLDLAGENQRTEMIKQLFKRDQLDQEKQKVIGKFGLELIKSIPFIDGESQQILMEEFFTDNWQVLRHLLSSYPFKKDDFKNKSLLYIFLEIFAMRGDDEGPVEKNVWTKSMNFAIRPALNSEYGDITFMGQRILSDFFSNKDQQAIQFAEQMIKTTLTPLFKKLRKKEALNRKQRNRLHPILEVYDAIISRGYDSLSEKEMLPKRNVFNGRYKDILNLVRMEYPNIKKAAISLLASAITGRLLPMPTSKKGQWKARIQGRELFDTIVDSVKKREIFGSVPEHFRLIDALVENDFLQQSDKPAYQPSDHPIQYLISQELLKKENIDIILHLTDAASRSGRHSDKVISLLSSLVKNDWITKNQVGTFLYILNRVSMRLQDLPLEKRSEPTIQIVSILDQLNKKHTFHKEHAERVLKITTQLGPVTTIESSATLLNLLHAFLAKDIATKEQAVRLLDSVQRIQVPIEQMTGNVADQLRKDLLNWLKLFKNKSFLTPNYVTNFLNIMFLPAESPNSKTISDTLQLFSEVISLITARLDLRVLLDLMGRFARSLEPRIGETTFKLLIKLGQSKILNKANVSNKHVQFFLFSLIEQLAKNQNPKVAQAAKRYYENLKKHKWIREFYISFFDKKIYGKKERL